MQRDGYAFDDEEFLPGLLCLAVLVPAAERRRSQPVRRGAGAGDAPRRATRRRQLLPALQRAAQALGAHRRRRRRGRATP